MNVYFLPWVAHFLTGLIWTECEKQLSCARWSGAFLCIVIQYHPWCWITDHNWRLPPDSSPSLVIAWDISAWNKDLVSRQNLILSICQIYPGVSERGPSPPSTWAGVGGAARSQSNWNSWHRPRPASPCMLLWHQWIKTSEGQLGVWCVSSQLFCTGISSGGHEEFIFYVCLHRR